MRNNYYRVEPGFLSQRDGEIIAFARPNLAVPSAYVEATVTGADITRPDDVRRRILTCRSVLLWHRAWRPTMMRLSLAAAAALTGVFVGLQPVKAQAPWCAVITIGEDSVVWDCQYRSFEDCYRRGNILAGNIGFCNPSPYYVAGSAEQRQTRNRRARPQ